MAVTLLLSVIVWLTALAWVILLLFRRQDWRLAFFGGMVALLALHEVLTIPGMPEPVRIYFADLPGSLHFLLVSVLALLAVFAFDRMLRTERKRGFASASEQVVPRLREMSDALAASQRLGKIGNWRWDMRGNRLISCSEEFARIHGVSSAEIVALLERNPESHEYAARVIHPDDQPRVREAFHRFEQEGLDYQIEYRIKWPDGTVRHVLEVGETIRDADGRIVEQLGTVQDITERKQAEEELHRYHETLEQLVEQRTAALRESEQRFRSIFNTAAAGIGRCRFSDGRMLLANEKLASMFGYDSVDQFVSEFAAAEHHADEYDSRRIFDSFLDARGQPVECRWKRRDGTVITVETHAIADDAAGTLDFVAIDVTDRKEIERILRGQEALIHSLIEHAPVGISIKDLEGRYQFASHAFAEYVGMQPEDLVGKSIEEIVDASAAARVQEEDNRVLEAAKHSSRLEAFEQQLGARTMLLSKFPVKDRDGRVTGIGTVGIDVTESRRLEDSLRRNEAMVSALIEHSPVAVSIKGLDGRYQFVSPAFSRYLDLPAAEAVGKRAAEVMGREAAAMLDAADQMVLSSGEALHHDDAFLVQFGASTVLVTKFPVKDRGGRLIGSGTVGIDMTEHRRVEEALRQSEAYLRALVDASPSAINVKDLDGRYALANPAFARNLGLERDQILGRKAEEVGRMGLEHKKVVEAMDAEVLRTGKVVTGEHQARLPGNRFPYYSLIKFPVRDPNGRLIGVGTMATDVSEKKQAEERLLDSERRLRAAQKIARIGIWELKIDGTLHWSDEVFEIFGIEPQKFDDTTRLFRESVHPDDHHLVDEASTAAWHKGVPYDCVHRIIWPDGAIRTVHEMADLVFDEHGNTIRANGTVQDITEQVEAEARLAQAQKMEAVGQLTGGIAHDFNNLLAVIQGNAEMLAGVARDSAVFTDPIIRATQRGAELTQRLLAFSRRQPLRPKAIRLDELVQGMSDMLSRTLGETIEVETVSSPKLWQAMADPGQVESAVLNLAINARGAMPDGGRLVIECSNLVVDPGTASERHEVEPGEYVTLSVTDTGTGMSPEVLARAFEPFFTTKEVGQGSGLGLSMVYGFAKQSGGHVTIYSELGKGTTVKLYLPRSRTAASEAADEVRRAPPVGNGETILVIEDDPDVRELSVRMLQSLNYRIIDVIDAAAARAVLTDGQAVDLVLSDVVLPGGISGPQFADEARRMRPGLKVIFMSGYPAEAAMRNGFLGSDAVLLNKPFRRQQVAEALHRALRVPERQA